MVHGRFEAEVDIDSLRADFDGRFKADLASLLGFPEGRPTTADGQGGYNGGIYCRITIEAMFSGSFVLAFSIAPTVDVDLHCEDGQSGISFMQPVPGRYLLLTDDPVHWQCLTVEDLHAMAEYGVLHRDPYTGVPPEYLFIVSISVQNSDRDDGVSGRNFSPQKLAEVARLISGDPIYYGLDGQPDGGVPFEISELEFHFQNEEAPVFLGGVMMKPPKPPPDPEPEPEPGPEPEPEPIFASCVFSLDIGGFPGTCEWANSGAFDASIAVVMHGTICLTDCHPGYTRSGGALHCNDGRIRYVEESLAEIWRPGNATMVAMNLELQHSSTAARPACTPPETEVIALLSASASAVMTWSAPVGYNNPPQIFTSRGCICKLPFTRPAFGDGQRTSYGCIEGEATEGLWCVVEASHECGHHHRVYHVETVSSLESAGVDVNSDFGRWCGGSGNETTVQLGNGSWVDCTAASNRTVNGTYLHLNRTLSQPAPTPTAGYWEDYWWDTCRLPDEVPADYAISGSLWNRLAPAAPCLALTRYIIDMLSIPEWVDTVGCSPAAMPAGGKLLPGEGCTLTCVDGYLGRSSQLFCPAIDVPREQSTWGGAMIGWQAIPAPPVGDLPQCALPPPVPCADLWLPSAYDTAACNGLEPGANCTISCRYGFDGNGTAEFGCSSENRDDTAQPRWLYTFEPDGESPSSESSPLDTAAIGPQTFCESLSLTALNGALNVLEH